MIRKSKNTSIIRSSAAEYLTYVAATGSSDESIELRYEDENIWLTQKMMATLYGVNVRTINDHIKKIYLRFFDVDFEQDQDGTFKSIPIKMNICAKFWDQIFKISFQFHEMKFLQFQFYVEIIQIFLTLHSILKQGVY